MEPKKSRNTIQSLKIGLSIIDVIVSEKRPLGIAEIQEQTQITKSNLYKYLNTLIQDDLIYRNEQTGLYHLGTKLIQYGMAAMENKDIVATITPYLQSISSYTKSSVIFAVPTYNGPVIVKIRRSNQILSIGAELGTLLPPNSATGKVFHMFSNDSMVDTWKKIHERVINGDKVEFQKIKTEKIAFANEPLIPQVSSVAIPIFSFNNELVGIITVVGFSSDVPQTISEPISQYLQEMQEEIG